MLSPIPKIPAVIWSVRAWKELHASASAVSTFATGSFAMYYKYHWHVLDQSVTSGLGMVSLY